MNNQSNRNERISVSIIRSMKGKTKIAALTAVDMSTAKWCDESGIDIVLVGDSLGMVSLGMPNTQDVSMEQMITATSAARRGLNSNTPPLLVTDIPLCGLEFPIENARKLISAGADAVKVECHEKGFKIVKELVSAGIEVMAHVGLMPQTVTDSKGYKLQGKEEEKGKIILDASMKAEEDGAFSCVLEKIPSQLALQISKSLSIPTIGIGAGPHCDGQILVIYDILGVFERFRPKFVRRYLEMSVLARKAVSEYTADVKSGRFPSEKESFE